MGADFSGAGDSAVCGGFYTVSAAGRGEFLRPYGAEHSLTHHHTACAVGYRLTPLCGLEKAIGTGALNGEAHRNGEATKN